MNGIFSWIQANSVTPDWCTTDFWLWRTICLFPVPCISLGQCNIWTAGILCWLCWDVIFALLLVFGLGWILYRYIVPEDDRLSIKIDDLVTWLTTTANLIDPYTGDPSGKQNSHHFEIELNHVHDRIINMIWSPKWRFVYQRGLPVYRFHVFKCLLIYQNASSIF